jgi:hypothetical protein
MDKYIEILATYRIMYILKNEILATSRIKYIFLNEIWLHEM